MPVKIEYVAIDSNLGLNSYDLRILEEVLENKGVFGTKILLLRFSNANGKVQEVLESYANFDVSEELENKANSCDIKSIFDHFSTLEGKTLTGIKEKIRFGKKILYLDAVSNSFIRKFVSNQECPGFWNLAVGTFCRHECLYCFLNLTMRIRPLCVEHLNLSRLKSNLKYFNRKHSSTLLNAGESSDPLDNEPLLHIWNKIVDLVRGYGNKILCLTKSKNVDSIPEADESLRNTAIYSWSINPPDVVRRYELNTASSEARLEAAHHLRDFGYRIRFRVDPIMPLNLMDALSEGYDIPVQDIDLEGYFKLIDQFDRIGPEMVTFGTFRALPPLFNFLRDNSFKKGSLVKNGKRFRIPRRFRYHMYQRLGAYSQDLLGCHIAICKDPSIDLTYSTLKGPCQCMEIS